MKRNMNRSVIAIVCGMVLATGCAKKEMVKHEDKLVTSTTQSETVSPPLPPPIEKISGQETIKDVATSSEPVQETVLTPVGKTSLETIYFDFDSYLLSGESRDKLQKNAHWLRNNLIPKVQVEGHTDERGSDAYNLALGEKRARSVMNYMVNLGIAADRLSIISYGEERPAEQGHGEDTWAKNRRAEFVVVER